MAKWFERMRNLSFGEVFMDVAVVGSKNGDDDGERRVI